MGAKPKVVIVGWDTHSGVYGGLEVHLRRVFSFLKESRDIDFWILLPSWNGKAVKDEKKRILRVPILKGTLMDTAVTYARNIAKILESYAFDVLHTHDWMGAMAALILKRGRAFRWVHTHHSLWFTRQLFMHEKDEIMRIELETENADVTITVSKLMKMAAEKNGLCVDDVVYGGSSFDDANCKVIGRDGNTCSTTKQNRNGYFLYVGRLTKHKGIDLLIHAYRKYLDLADNPKKLVVVGCGEQENKLRWLLNLLNLRSMVKVAGFLSKSELLRLYAEAHVAIHPAYFEPYGISLVDCAKLKVPLIASRNCGALEVLKNVTVMQSLSSGNIAETMLKASEAKSKLNPARCATNISWNDVAQKYVQYYLDVS